MRTQIDLIRSLGDTLSWYEREIDWGTNPSSLNHLVGRIGELYVAVITNGMMSEAVNQRGWDVSCGNQKISVKTTSSPLSRWTVFLKKSTFAQVDRVIVVRVDSEERKVSILYDELSEKAKKDSIDRGLNYKLSMNTKLAEDDIDLKSTPARVENYRGEFVISELVNGGYRVVKDGKSLKPVRPKLIEIARELGIPTTNENGGELHTRRLGGLVLRELGQKK